MMMMVIIKRRIPCRSVCACYLVRARVSRVHQHLQEFKNNLFYPSCQSHAQSPGVARCSKKLARKLQCFMLKTTQLRGSLTAEQQSHTSNGCFVSLQKNTTKIAKSRIHTPAKAKHRTKLMLSMV